MDNKEPNRMSDNHMHRKKALDAALGQIERQFGKGTIQFLGDAPKTRMPSVSTGSLGLDVALGIGGLPWRANRIRGNP